MQISFKASLPAVHGAIDIHGMDGVRIKLDVAEDSLPQALKMVMFKGQVLLVTVEGEGEPVEVPRVPKREGERYSASQKLRQAIWAEWQAEGGKGAFDPFYHKRMDGIIEGVNTGSL